MDAVQRENIMLVLFPVVFGVVPAIASVVGFRRKIPNLLLSLIAATTIALTSPIWIANSRMDNILTVFVLLCVPAILISYLASLILMRLALWTFRAISGR